jgi:hypothetical protein
MLVLALGVLGRMKDQPSTVDAELTRRHTRLSSVDSASSRSGASVIDGQRHASSSDARGGRVRSISRSAEATN